MPTTSTVSNTRPTKQTWWDVVAVLSDFTTPIFVKQIEDGKASEPDWQIPGKSMVPYWESEAARAREENVPPGISVSVPLATKGPRQITGLLSEALRRNTFDWIESAYEHYVVELHSPGDILVKFDVYDPTFLTVSVEHSMSFAAPRDIQRETTLLDRIEEILKRSPAPLPPAPEFRVVMGHGNDQQWRILRDELRDHHGFEVTAFEGRPRAGLTINAVLEDMAIEASVALIVLTQADEMKDGTFRARQNVVHEVGFFQGRLGWTNAIAVVEDGVELFSNLDGTQQIRFPKGNISAAVGNVSATLSAKKRQREAEPGRRDY